MTEYTTKEMRSLLKNMSGMYDLARVVDPIECRILSFQEDGTVSMNETCYGIWNAGQKCVNCSSALACRTGCHQEKAEHFQDRVFHIQSNPIRLKLPDGAAYDAVVELVSVVDEAGSAEQANDRAAENVNHAAAEYQAIHDEVTGVLKAGAFYELARGMIVRNPQLSWVMISGNIMNFRLVNTLFGVLKGNADLKLQNDRLLHFGQLRPTWKDLLLCLLLLAAATGVGFVFTRFGFSESNLITVFILGVLITSVVTVSPVFSVVSSLASVLLFNYFFTEPKFSLQTYGTEYVVTFGIMLISSLITGTLANRLKENASHSALEAFRAKVLFDTNQLLQKAGSSEAVISITANQLITLLDRDVIVCPLGEHKTLEPGTLFRCAHSDGKYLFQDQTERDAAAWVFQHQQIAGAHSSQFSAAQALYFPICINSYCYGVFGIHLENKPLEAFEYSVVLSILGECALALESLRNAQEKEQAAVIAHNEQLRSNLLRSISHDIRTPLTSISGKGNAEPRNIEMISACDLTGTA